MHSERTSFLDWAFEVAGATAKRSTCARRAVGCALFNARRHILATGYNGVAVGQPHCNHVADEPIYGPEYKQTFSGKTSRYRDCIGFKKTRPHACPGVDMPSGQGLDLCHAIHAEQNALLQCHDIHAIDVAVVTTAPCVTCTKLLLNTTCRAIYFKDPYASSGEALWRAAGREWLERH